MLVPNNLTCKTKNIESKEEPKKKTENNSDEVVPTHKEEDKFAF